MPTKFKKLQQVASAGQVYWDCAIMMTPEVTNQAIYEMIEYFEKKANEEGYSLHKTHLKKFLIDWRNELRREKKDLDAVPDPAIFDS